MKYPPKYFRNGLPEWKRKKDNIIDRYTSRPLSFFVSSLCAEFGIKPNTVSIVSTFVAIAACVSYILIHPIIAAVFLFIWDVLDCTDGNLARSFGGQKYGDFVDGMSSYLCVGLMFTCMGFCVYNTGGVFIDPGNPWIILIGALASSADSLARLFYQKFQVGSFLMGINEHVDSNPEEVKSGLQRMRIGVEAYVSIGGFQIAFLALAAVFNFLDVAIIAWFVYYILVLLASSFYLVHRTVLANKED